MDFGRQLTDSFINVFTINYDSNLDRYRDDVNHLHGEFSRLAAEYDATSDYSLNNPEKCKASSVVPGFEHVYSNTIMSWNWLEKYGEWLGNESVFGADKFKGMQGKLEIIGMSPCNDEHLFLMINNSHVTSVDYYYHCEDDRMRTQQKINKKMTFKKVDRLWAKTKMTEEVRYKIEQYGAEVDRLSIGGEYDKLRLLLDEMEQAKNGDEEIKGDAAFNYYLGTAYGAYSDYLVRSGKCHTDLDVIELHRTSMFYLRKGIAAYDPSIHTDPRAQLRILTNYANGLDTTGRVIEALRIYRRALSLNDHFSIARGNYGRALQFLANMVNDGGHYKELHCYAYQSVKKALSVDDPDMHEQAIAAFQRVVDQYEASPSWDFLVEPIVNKEYELGESKEEIEYRTWCLNNHLFLNPLNEVRETDSAFAHDPLTIATYTEDVYAADSVSGNPAEPPRWFAMLNQLKEEYAYARYLCFEGCEKHGDVHFADKDVKLSLASYDYTNYSIRIEQLKSSFRILYSMLDQICFFVNDFWKLGLNERKADAFHICKASNYPKDNIVLMSLYWVLCEFFEKYGDAETASEKDLSTLRNAFEHKFVKVHEYEWKKALQLESDSFYHVSENDLKAHTMRLLELSREALMYLVYAIGVEESKKEKSEKSVSMPLTDFPDEWKR